VVTHGLLARMRAQPHQNAEVEQFLQAALPQVRAEPATAAWFALRGGRHDYAVFDAFSSEEGRLAHLEGPVAKALVSRTPWLFNRQPDIETVEVIANKMPAQLRAHDATCGVLLSFRAKKGHEADVEQFLRTRRRLRATSPAPPRGSRCAGPSGATASSTYSPTMPRATRTSPATCRANWPSMHSSCLAACRRWT
jgi:quinol monooxygenase YgiN